MTTQRSGSVGGNGQIGLAQLLVKLDILGFEAVGVALPRRLRARVPARVRPEYRE